MPDELRQYYNSSGVVTLSESRDDALFQVISSSLKLQNSVHIFNQSTIISMFLSDVEILSSVIEGIVSNSANFRITSSTFIIRNSALDDIISSSGSELFFVNLDSSIIIDTCNFTQSTSSFLISRNSNVTIKSLTMHNISFDSTMLQISQSVNIIVDQLDISQVSIMNNRPIFLISDSSNVQLAGLNISNQDELVLSIVSSTIDMINDFTITN